MSRNDWIMALPLIREAINRATGGSIGGDKNKLVLTIELDVASLFAAIDFARAAKKDTSHE